ncbi:MAG: hypothetical protein ACXW1D_00810 [Halobacteriota archaeon]
MKEGANVGDVVVFSNANWLTDVTQGKEYTITGHEYDEMFDDYPVFFIDDAGEENFAASIDGNGIFEVVVRHG